MFPVDNAVTVAGPPAPAGRFLIALPPTDLFSPAQEEWSEGYCREK
jgi:hypothetical protein